MTLYKRRHSKDFKRVFLKRGRMKFNNLQKET